MEERGIGGREKGREEREKEGVIIRFKLQRHSSSNVAHLAIKNPK